MDAKKKWNPKAVGILAGILLLLIAILLAVVFIRKNKGYRVIQVYDLEGRSVIARTLNGKRGQMDAYVNLNLLSADQVGVLEESLLRLKLDQDKYMLAEENTSFNIQATGKEKNSKTDIYLESGAMTLEVQNKLGQQESFRITTPNAVMAVRGTVFRVSLETDENGNPVTRVTLFEGQVDVWKTDESGKKLEQQTISQGKQAVIRQRAEGEPIILIHQIPAEELPLEVLEYLKDISETGRQLCYPEKEIQELIDALRKAGENEENTEPTVPETTGETIPETTPETVPAESAETQPPVPSVPETTEPAVPETTVPATAETVTEPVPEEILPEPTAEETVPETTAAEETVPETTAAETTEPPTEPPAPPAPPAPTDPPVKMYTVRFLDGKGNLFATQKVEEGKLAVPPKLQPAAAGFWDKIIEKPITQDTDICFNDAV